MQNFKFDILINFWQFCKIVLTFDFHQNFSSGSTGGKALVVNAKAAGAALRRIHTVVTGACITGFSVARA